MRHSHVIRGLGIPAMLTLLTVPAPARAQRPWRVVVGGGIPVGRGADCCDASTEAHNLLGAAVPLDGTATGLRLDAMMLLWSARPSPVALAASLTRHFGTAAVRPYVLGGVGWYGVGRAGDAVGVQGGAGLEVAAGRFGAFTEYRGQAASRAVLSAGITIGPPASLQRAPCD